MIGSVSRKFLYVVGKIAQVGCVLHVVTTYVAEPTLCTGQSMKPTINSASRNDIVLTEHVSTNLQILKKNDIVIVRSPQDPSISICKRITGMEGDIIEASCIDKPIRVPRGHVWLSGDNVDNSVDSRTYGPVPCGLILGKVSYKVHKSLVLPWLIFGNIREPNTGMTSNSASNSAIFDFTWSNQVLAHWIQLTTEKRVFTAVVHYLDSTYSRGEKPAFGARFAGRNAPVKRTNANS